MANGIVVRDGRFINARIYGGEDIGILYPDGTVAVIPPDTIHKVLRDATLPDGEPCHVLLDLSPLTRLPIIILDTEKDDLYNA